MKYSDELMHFGIPGMKWGRRKDRSSYSKNIRNLRKFQKERRRNTDITKLSDADLNKLNNRIASEERYIDLNRKKSSKFISDVINQSGTKIAIAAATTLGAVAIARMMTNPSTKDLFMKFVTPKKK